MDKKLVLKKRGCISRKKLTRIEIDRNPTVKWRTYFGSDEF